MTNNNWIEEFIEKGADLEHDRWAKWQDYLHSKLIYHEIPSGGKMMAWYLLDAGNYEHWTRQINTDYKDLSEKEKESDRIEVRKYLPLIQSLLTQKDQEHKAELEMIREVFWETYDKNSDYYSESTEKGEMDNSNEAAYTTSVLNQIIKGLRDKGIELEETTAILDTHINKLSTE